MKPVEENWTKGWLKKKQYCRNPNHIYYNTLIDNIVRDIRDGQNRIILIVGTPRSGKSYFSLWLASYMNWCLFGKETTANDIFWDIDKFIEATRDAENHNKFIVMEETGVSHYKLNFWSKDVVGFDKITQIFGVDNTNLILNLPYVFDIHKGTRLKAHYLVRCYRIGKKRVDARLYYKWLGGTTEKATFRPMGKWVMLPNIITIKPKLIEAYECKKLEYNLRQKNEELNKMRPKLKQTQQTQTNMWN